uniref:Laminin subunit alpha-5 n=1 Tax=Eptatretus burgeri TaxID=7764 RepID=A0A8C4QD94_EPTBU
MCFSAAMCVPSGSLITNSLQVDDSCLCREHVTGRGCETCKPLFWNLSSENLLGCQGCECNVHGTLSGVAECQQTGGQCFCRTNVKGRQCHLCKDHFHNLQGNNIFGCRGCACDVGGSTSRYCDRRTGACSCRANIEGLHCDRPRPSHYFPGPHHLQFEVEDGVTPERDPVRFGYDRKEFESFSWRGYAQMSDIQPVLVLRVMVELPQLYRLVFRYSNPNAYEVHGTVSISEDFTPDSCWSCAEQSRPMTFMPTSKPAFTTVPGEGTPTPFVFIPGTWYIIIEAKGVFLDYLVLLPSTYYEAGILQMDVTEPCVINQTAQSEHSCLQFDFLSLGAFPGVVVLSGFHLLPDGGRIPVSKQQPSPVHPFMAKLGFSQHNVHVQLTDLQPGESVLVLEYAGFEGPVHDPRVTVRHGPSSDVHALLHVTLCPYSFLCRVVAVDYLDRLAVFHLGTSAEIVLSEHRGQLFIHKVYLIPSEEFTLEYVEPKMHCIARQAGDTQHSPLCQQSSFTHPEEALKVEAEGSDRNPLPDSTSHGPRPVTRDHRPTRPPPMARVTHGLVLLEKNRLEQSFTTTVPNLGRYVLVGHFFQPEGPAYTATVSLEPAVPSRGKLAVPGCLHSYGCRSAAEFERGKVVEVPAGHIVITIRIPPGTTLWLDYILLVLENNYGAHVLEEQASDSSADFIKICGANSFHLDLDALPAFCGTAARSIAAHHHKGAVPCGCHEAGSLSPSCHTLSGECKCRANIIGRQCTRCATGYYGFPYCTSCKCGSRLCDEVTGECICPPRTIMPECDRCEPNAFACHPLIGCQRCKCEPLGLIGPSAGPCDVETGQCRCKENVDGRRCDRCLPGFHGFPNCLPCSCHRPGVMQTYCDPFTGQCLCKENVMGNRCDRCRPGTFSLEALNPKGCTSCFCFGATRECHTSLKHWTQLEDLQGWTLTGSDLNSISIRSDPSLSMVQAQAPSAFLGPDLYWTAPKTYLGDRVLSYGGVLKYRVGADVAPDVNVVLSQQKRPDVILSGNGLMAMHFSREVQEGDEHHVQLLEGNFVHGSSGKAVTREELMMLLAGLQHLRILAMPHPPASALYLHSAQLSLADTQGSGTAAHSVEHCLCPTGYGGESCQECMPGHYRVMRGFYLGHCLPCQCNGHSNRCSDTTGTCINCEHNTEGQHCENCSPNYLGNASLGSSQPCLLCPCPLSTPSNSFSIGCSHENGHVHCTCMKGYTGPKCERCVPGYFGNPLVLGSSCQKCNCNMNSDPNMIFPDCDGLTGICRSCVQNTAGPHCETCAPGYFGDAIHAKNCSRCACDVCGSQRCDEHAGDCSCRPGVAGPHCDRCQDGYFGFHSCQGCRPCQCGPAATDIHCDAIGGQCQCQPGVTGLHCDHCLPGFWNYHSSGCQRCNCHTGHCNPEDGTCTCAGGMVGEHCNRCANPLAVPVPVPHHQHSICQTCDNCVTVLVGEINGFLRTLEMTRHQVQDINGSLYLHNQLDAMKASASALQFSTSRSEHILRQQQNDLKELERKMQRFPLKMDKLFAKANGTAENAEQLKSSTMESRTKVTGVVTMISKVAARISELLGRVNWVEESLQPDSNHGTEDFHRKLSEAERLLGEMRRMRFQDQLMIAKDEKREAEFLLNQTKERFEIPHEQLLDRVGDVRRGIQEFRSKLSQMQEVIVGAGNDVQHATALNAANVHTLMLYERNLKALEMQVEKAEDDLDSIKNEIDEGYIFLENLEHKRKEYDELSASLDGHLRSLAKKVNNVARAPKHRDLVMQAEEHAHNLTQLAGSLAQFVHDDEHNGFTQRAINASTVYEEIIKHLQKAESLANTSFIVAERAHEDVLDSNLELRASESQQKSQSLLDDSQEAKNNFSDLVPKKDRLQNIVNKAMAQKDRLNNSLSLLMKDLEELEIGNVTELLNRSVAASREAQAIAQELQEAIVPMKENMTEWQKRLGDAPADGRAYRDALISANRTITQLTETVPLLYNKLKQLQQRIPVQSIANNITRIQDLIAQARDAANRVCT